MTDGVNNSPSAQSAGSAASSVCQVIEAVTNLTNADASLEATTAVGENNLSEILDQLYSEWDTTLGNEEGGTSTEDQQKFEDTNTTYQNETTIYNSIISSMNTQVTNLSSAQSQLVQFAQAVMGILTNTATLLATPLTG